VEIAKSTKELQQTRPGVVHVHFVAMLRHVDGIERANLGSNMGESAVYIVDGNTATTDKAAADNRYALGMCCRHLSARMLHFACLVEFKRLRLNKSTIYSNLPRLSA
jgi:hypothetical protein